MNSFVPYVYSNLDITTIIIIETGRDTMEEKTHITLVILTTVVIMVVIVTGTINLITVTNTTGENEILFSNRSFSKKKTFI